MLQDIRDAVIREIQGSPTVTGVVAWITCPQVLAALQACGYVALVANQENWLDRPRAEWVRKIKDRYRKLKGPGIKMFETQKNVPVRYRPRCHSKFLVFYSGTTPTHVVTGSFNLTANSSKSIENIVIIRDRAIARFYHDEVHSLLKHCSSGSG